MLTEPTLDQMRQLGLHGMCAAYLELRDNVGLANLTRDEWLGLLLDREVTSRFNKRLTTRLKAAKLRQQAVFEDIDFRAPRGLDRAAVIRLGTSQWIRDKTGLIITGPSGVGKTFLACAFGHKACRDDLTVVYRRSHRLLATLGLARHDGSYNREFRTLTRANLLILDDFGPEPLTAEQRRDLLEIIEERYGIGSTLITSQIPVDGWHQIIANSTIADAILDRLVHAAIRIELRGESLRKHQKSTEANSMT
jgi:DNA replication protein DnaC